MLTWARQHSPEEQEKLNDAYLKIAQELGADVAPVGMAWHNARHEDPEVQLYHEDGAHPGPAGSYLAACVFYATLTGNSPVGLPKRIMGKPAGWKRILTPPADLADLDEDQAAFLQRVAWDAVRGLPLIRAADRGGTNTVKSLLAKGVDVNARAGNGTALMLAAKKGHTDTVKVLLAHGADVDAKGANGETALMAAADEGHTDTGSSLAGSWCGCGRER